MENNKELRKLQRQRENERNAENYELFSKDLSLKNPVNKREADFSTTVWEDELRPFFLDVVNKLPAIVKDKIDSKLKSLGVGLDDKKVKEQYEKSVNRFLKTNVELLVFLTVKTALDLCILRKQRDGHVSLQDCVDKIGKEIYKQMLLSKNLTKAIDGRKKTSKLPEENKDELLKVLKSDLIHIAGYFLDCVIENQDVITRGRSSSKKGMYVIELSPKIATYYDPSIAAKRLFRPLKEPMVCEPERWSSALQGGGYLTKTDSFLVNVKSSKHKEKILVDLSTVKKKKIFLNAVFSLQRTPWVVNKRILEVLEYVVNNEIFNTDAIERKLLLKQSIWLAEEYKSFVFYMPWYLDFRGRMYTSVYQLSPQAHDEGRSLLMFAEEQRITSKNERETLEYLYVYGYNKYKPSSSKASKKDMIAWVENNEKEITKSAKNPERNIQFWGNASDKYSFLAFCFELSRIKELNCQNRSTQLPVYVDGTCNGFQHYAALLRDETAAPFVNLVDNEFPGDFYQEVANSLRESVGDPAVEDEDLKEIILQYVNRSFIKKSVISAGYGAGIDTRAKVTAKNLYDTLVNDNKNNLYSDWLVEYNQKQLKDRTKIGRISIDIELVLDTAINDLCPSFSVIKDWLVEVGGIVNKKNECIGWETPSGFCVSNYYYKFPTKDIKLYIGRTPHKISFRNMECASNTPIDEKKIMKSMAPNFIHSLDSSHAAFIISNFYQTPFEQVSSSLTSIHDSFATHATHINELHKIIRQTFFDIYSEDQLLKFKNQVEERYCVVVPELPHRGGLDISEVLNSKYFFY